MTDTPASQVLLPEDAQEIIAHLSGDRRQFQSNEQMVRVFEFLHRASTPQQAVPAKPAQAEDVTLAYTPEQDAFEDFCNCLWDGRHEDDPVLDVPKSILKVIWNALRGGSAATALDEQAARHARVIVNLLGDWGPDIPHADEVDHPEDWPQEQLAAIAWLRQVAGEQGKEQG